MGLQTNFNAHFHENSIHDIACTIERQRKTCHKYILSDMLLISDVWIIVNHFILWITIVWIYYLKYFFQLSISKFYLEHHFGS